MALLKALCWALILILRNRPIYWSHNKTKWKLTEFRWHCVMHSMRARNSKVLIETHSEMTIWLPCYRHSVVSLWFFNFTIIERENTFLYLLPSTACKWYVFYIHWVLILFIVEYEKFLCYLTYIYKRHSVSCNMQLIFAVFNVVVIRPPKICIFQVVKYSFYFAAENSKKLHTAYTLLFVNVTSFR